jgi:Membrane bound O-acyl transferase family
MTQPAKPEKILARIGYLPLVILPLAVFILGRTLLPWVFMWLLAASIFFALKWLSWCKAAAFVPHSFWRSLAYLLAWPGMDAEAFLNANRTAARPRWPEWIWAVTQTALGAVLFWVVPRSNPHFPPLLQGWIGMLGLVLLLHFGSFRLVALVWQSLGVDAKPIMAAPLRSTSLSEFWGRRWNLGFSQLSHDLVVGPLRKSLGPRSAGFLVFVISGLIHDLVISVPARGGYGLPTAYFLIQGCAVWLERSAAGKILGLRRGIRGWLFMAVVLLAPVGWLFHPPFVLRVIIPFMKAVRAL